MNNDKKLEFLRKLEQLKAAPVKSEDYVSPLEGDVMKVKGGKVEPELVTKIKGATQHIDNKSAQKVLSGNDFASKIAALRGLKGAGKKMLGMLPLAGTIGGLLSGDPAMAAEEAAGDIIPGLEAIKSDSAGMSPEDEKMMLAEIDQRKKSEAALSKNRKLKQMISERNPAGAKEEINQVKLPGFDSGIAPEKLDEERRKIIEQKLKAEKLLNNQRDPASIIEDDSEPTELSLDQAPGLSAMGEEPPSPESIAPAMQDQIRNQLQRAEEMKPEDVRAMRLRRLIKGK